MASFPRTSYFSGHVSGPHIMCVADDDLGYYTPTIGDVVCLSDSTIVTYQPVVRWDSLYQATNPTPLGVVTWVRGGGSYDILVQTGGLIPQNVTGIISGTGIYARVTDVTARLAHSTTLDSRVVGSITTNHQVSWGGKQPATAEQLVFAGLATESLNGWLTLGARNLLAGSWNLEALLESGEGGTTCEVQLIRDSNGAVLRNLSTTALGRSLQIGGFTLASNDYVVAQLRTGTVGIGATCYHVGITQ